MLLRSIEKAQYYVHNKKDESLSCFTQRVDDGWEGFKLKVKFCWGNFKQADQRISEVVHKYPDALCFGLTKSGKPFHPLAMMYAGLTNKPQLIKYKVV